MRLGKHKVEIALLVLVPALALWLWFVDRGSVTTNEAAMRKRNLLHAWRREQVASIAVDRPDGAFRIEKRVEGGGDSMFYVARAGEKAELADQTSVDRLLSALEFAVPDHKVDRGLERHAMGLDAPRVRLVVTMGPLSYDLAIGGEAPAPKGASYAELAGETPVVVPRDLVAQLELPIDAYRSRTLVPYLSPDLSQLSIDGPGGERHFVRGAWGGWALEGTPQVRADRDVLDRVLAAFADIRAEAFVAEADAEKALATDHVTITMVPSGAGRARAVLAIGGACPGHPEDVVVVRSEPSRITACAPKGIMEALVTPREALVDRHLFSLRPDEVEQIAFARGGEKLELARKGSSWHMRAPKDVEVDADAGNALAKSIHDLTADRIVPEPDLAALGLSPASATATVEKAGEDPAQPGGSEVLELGAANGHVVYARRRADGAVLELGRDVARALEPTVAAVRSRKIVEVPLAKVRKVTIHAGAMEQTLARSSEGMWTLKAPAGFDVDPSLASDVAEALGELTADRWVADTDDGSFGLATPRATYELEVADGGDAGTSTIRIVVGGAANGGAFARRDGMDGIFVLPRAVLRRCESYAIDRGPFLVAPSELRRLVLRANGATVTLKRSGARMVPDGASTISAERIQTIVDALSDLRAEGVVHLGAARKDEGLDKPQLALEIERVVTGSTKPELVKVAIGAGDAWDGTSVFYARRAGVDATYAVAQSKVRKVLEAM